MSEITVKCTFLKIKTFSFTYPTEIYSKELLQTRHESPDELREKCARVPSFPWIYAYT